MSVWISGTFDQALSDEQSKRLTKWLATFGGDSDDYAVGEEFVLGWITDRAWMDWQDKIEAKLPAGVSLKVWYDFDGSEYDHPTVAHTYYGPRKLEMELEDIDTAIEELKQQRIEVEKLMAKEREGA